MRKTKNNPGYWAFVGALCLIVIPASFGIMDLDVTDGVKEFALILAGCSVLALVCLGLFRG